MALKLQPPYILCATFCKLHGSPEHVTGIAEFTAKLIVTGDTAGKEGAIFDLDPLFVRVAPGGLVGERSISVVHRPPSGPTLPKQTMSGPMVAGLTTIDMVFLWGRVALFAGTHLFDVVYNDRVLTQVPLVLQLGVGVLQ
jgi:hypothetical protein